MRKRGGSAAILGVGSCVDVGVDTAQTLTAPVGRLALSRTAEQHTAVQQSSARRPQGCGIRQRVLSAWAACLYSVGSVSLQRGPGGATEHRPACVSTPQRAYCHHRVWTIAISTQPRGRRLRRMLYVAPAVIHVVVPCGESLDSWRSRAARWARGSHDPSVCIIKADLPSVPYIEASNRSHSTPTAQSSSIATSPGFPSSRSCLHRTRSCCLERISI